MRIIILAGIIALVLGAVSYFSLNARQTPTGSAYADSSVHIDPRWNWRTVATGHGEAIILAALCREAVAALSGQSPSSVARHAVATLLAPAKAEGGIVIVDRKARIGFAHNAAAMQVATFDSAELRHCWVEPLRLARTS